MDDAEARVFAALDADDERAAASTAIEAHGPAVFLYLSRLLDDDDALDVFQQWAEDVWRGLRGFRRECRLRTWGFKLAYHALSRFRREPYRARRQRLPTSAGSRLAASVAQSSAIAADARRQQLRTLIDAKLTPDERALLYLRHDKELSWDEIAEILSEGGPPVTAQTLRKRYERIKEKIRQLAKDAGLLDDDDPE